MATSTTFCGATESRCSFTISNNSWILSGTESYVLCKGLNLACINSAPCSPKTSNSTCVLLAHGYCVLFKHVHFNGDGAVRER